MSNDCICSAVYTEVSEDSLSRIWFLDNEGGVRKRVAALGKQGFVYVVTADLPLHSGLQCVPERVLTSLGTARRFGRFLMRTDAKITQVFVTALRGAHFGGIVASLTAVDGPWIYSEPETDFCGVDSADQDWGPDQFKDSSDTESDAEPHALNKIAALSDPVSEVAGTAHPASTACSSVSAGSKRPRPECATELARE